MLQGFCRADERARGMCATAADGRAHGEEMRAQAAAAAWAACKEKLSSNSSDVRWEGASDSLQVPRGHGPAVDWLIAELTSEMVPLLGGLQDRSVLATVLGVIAAEGDKQAATTLVIMLTNAEEAMSARQSALWGLQHVFQGNTYLPPLDAVCALALLSAGPAGQESLRGQMGVAEGEEQQGNSGITASEGREDERNQHGTLVEFLHARKQVDLLCALRLDAISLLVVWGLQARGALPLGWGEGGVNDNASGKFKIGTRVCMLAEECVEHMECSVNRVREDEAGESTGLCGHGERDSDWPAVRRRLIDAVSVFLASFLTVASGSGGAGVSNVVGQTCEAPDAGGNVGAPAGNAGEKEEHGWHEVLGGRDVVKPECPEDEIWSLWHR